MYSLQPCSYTYSLPCSVGPNNYSSSLRASIPWLEPEKESGLPRGGHSCAQLRQKRAEQARFSAFERPGRRKSAPSGPPFGQARASGLFPTCVGRSRLPTATPFALPLRKRPTGSLALSFPPAARIVARCGVTLVNRLAAQDS